MVARSKPAFDIGLLEELEAEALTRGYRIRYRDTTITGGEDPSAQYRYLPDPLKPGAKSPAEVEPVLVRFKQVAKLRGFTVPEIVGPDLQPLAASTDSMLGDLAALVPAGWQPSNQVARPLPNTVEALEVEAQAGRAENHGLPVGQDLDPIFVRQRQEFARLSARAKAVAQSNGLTEIVNPEAIEQALQED